MLIEDRRKRQQVDQEEAENIRAVDQCVVVAQPYVYIFIITLEKVDDQGTMDDHYEVAYCKHEQSAIEESPFSFELLL